jgi:predicted amidophosphoribosyltransferase
VIRAVTYASCYVYSPTGTDAVCERSRLLRSLLKSSDAAFMLKYALRVRQEVKQSPLLADFFGATDVLVPVPGNTPYTAGGLWAAEHLAIALVQEGLGAASWSGLRRIRAVRKSATAAPGHRPTVGLHYESFVIERAAIAPDRIVLIDDVVTKGRTLLAAATRVHEAFPCAQIRAFALLRTMGSSPGSNSCWNPAREKFDGDPGMRTAPRSPDTAIDGEFTWTATGS